MMTVQHATLRFEQSIDATPPQVFAAYKDVEARQCWSAPNDTAAVRIEHADIRSGGVESTLCGDVSDMRYRTHVLYHLVEDDHRLVFSETLCDGERMLTCALITFEFRPNEHRGTTVVLTDQVTSFIGVDGIEGHRQGFSQALRNLKVYLEAPTLL